MKNITFIILILFSFSCHQNGKTKEDSVNKTEKSNDSKVSISIKQDTVLQNKTSKKLIEQLENLDDEQDCIFDQSTQTDFFLKDIKELENYTWDQETKTAEIVLNHHWSLNIICGGCDEFEFSAEFIHDRVLSFEDNKEEIFDRIIWIINLLEDFDEVDTIEGLIKNEHYTLTLESENALYVNFMNYKVYESYFMDFSTQDGITKFSISYLIN